MLLLKINKKLYTAGLNAPLDLTLDDLDYPGKDQSWVNVSAKR